MKLPRFALIASVVLASVGVQAAEIEERIIKVGHLVQSSHPISKATQKFAELVAAKSDGKMKVREFGNSALGSDVQQISALQGGVQEMVMPSTTVLGGMVKEFSMIDFPFSITNGQQADALLQGAFGKALYDKLPEKGLIGLDYWETGFRNFTNSRKPIMSADDLKGLKIRVLGNPLFVDAFAALGTNPVPMPFAEVYGALESKAIDAQENPYSIVVSSKFNEVQKYLSVSNHVYTANAVLISKKFWDKLSDTEKKIIKESVAEAGAYERKMNRDMAETSRKELEEKGMRVNDVPAPALAKMRELTQPVIDKFSASYDDGLVKLYRSEIQKIRGTVR